MCCYGDIITYQNVWFLQHINPARFQPCTLSICTDIPYFVILHHFVSTMWRHKSSNLHKPKSSITRQTRIINEFLVSKETVVLRRWERSKQKLGFIKRVDKGWITTVKDLESWRFIFVHNDFTNWQETPFWTESTSPCENRYRVTTSGLGPCSPQTFYIFANFEALKWHFLDLPHQDMTKPQEFINVQ